MFEHFYLGFIFIQSQITGKEVDISGRFQKGNVVFEWRQDPLADQETVLINLDGKPYENTPKLGTLRKYMYSSYLHRDILNYTKVSFAVRTCLNNGSCEDSQQYRFQIPEIVRVVSGKDEEIVIPISFFPATGTYSIRNMDTDIQYLQVQKSEITSGNVAKYIVTSRTDNTLAASKYIKMLLKNVSSNDAGYIVAKYGGGQINSPGIVIVVKGKPTKPNITGDINVTAGHKVTLTCQSRSTSAPSYYKLFPQITYTWYRNSSVVLGWSTTQYTFVVNKHDQFVLFRCKATENLSSRVSDTFNLKPVYGPDTESVHLVPRNPTHVRLIEGERFGPYTCLADCNPPCTYQWERRVSGRKYENDSFSGQIIEISSVNRNDTAKYRCQVTGDYSNSRGSKVAFIYVYLDVMYDTPLPPKDFTGHSVSSSSIHLTWRSSQLGQPTTFFLIFQLFEAVWEEIANYSKHEHLDLYTHTVSRRLLPERAYSFGIQSCNKVGCSTMEKELGIPTLGVEGELFSTLTVIGITLGGMVLTSFIFIIVIVKIKSNRHSGSGVEYHPSAFLTDVNPNRSISKINYRNERWTKKCDDFMPPEGKVVIPSEENETNFEEAYHDKISLKMKQTKMDTDVFGNQAKTSIIEKENNSNNADEELAVHEYEKVTERRECEKSENAHLYTLLKTKLEDTPHENIYE